MGHRILKVILRILRVFALLILVVIIAGAAGIGVFNAYYEGLTGMSLLDSFYAAKEAIADSTEDDFTIGQISYIYDADGYLLAELSAGDSENYTSYEDIPQYVIDAFVSVEDKTFWDNPGFQVKAIIRAGLSYLKTGNMNQGGSTITQQLMKLTLLTSDKTIERKVNEIFLAYHCTQKYSKQQIMEWYVNHCCFANGIYGITDAAYAYFGKTPSQLSLLECVYLCAIPNSPEKYNPWKDPTTVLDRAALILSDMLDEEYITEDQYSDAHEEMLNVQQNIYVSAYDELANYAVHCVSEYFMELGGFEFKNEFDTDEEYREYWDLYNAAYSEARDELYTGGYSIYTSLLTDAQDAVQGYLDEELAFDSAVTGNGSYNLQGSVTVVDNTTHKVVAICGGRSQDEVDTTYGINRAFQSYRQPGSCIKPILVYGPAIDNGYTKDSILYNIDVQTAYEYYADPEHSVSELTGAAYPLSTAVLNSYNGCAVWLYDRITPDTGLSYVYHLGLTHLTADDRYLAAALGGLTYGTNTLEMAGAYSVFPSYGEYVKPDCLISILDSEGNELYKEKDGSRVFSKNTAIEMSEILEGPVRSGTASSMNWYGSSDVTVAGKTGTTQVNADGWFCGFCDEYTIAVWVGSDDNSTVPGMWGRSYPASIWKNVMLWMLENEPVETEGSVFTAEKDPEQSHVTGTWHTVQAGNVRAGAGTEYEVLFVLSEGVDVDVIDMQQYWTLIEVNGQTGWISTQFLAQ